MQIDHDDDDNSESKQHNNNEDNTHRHRQRQRQLWSNCLKEQHFEKSLSSSSSSWRRRWQHGGCGG